MGSRRKVPRYRNPSAAHEAKATLYAKPRDPIKPVLSSDRAEMSELCCCYYCGGITCGNGNAVVITGDDCGEHKRVRACDVSKGSPVQRVSLATDGQLRLFRTWLIAES